MKIKVAVFSIVIILLFTGIRLLVKKEKAFEPLETASETIELLSAIWVEEKLFWAENGYYTTDVNYLLQKVRGNNKNLDFKMGFLNVMTSDKEPTIESGFHDFNLNSTDKIEGIVYSESVKDMDFTEMAEINCQDAAATKDAFKICMFMLLDPKKNLYVVLTLDQNKQIEKRELKLSLYSLAK